MYYLQNEITCNCFPGEHLSLQKDCTMSPSPQVDFSKDTAKRAINQTGSVYTQIHHHLFDAH